ncbi:ShlB/FhaC/HecB family hemolysin secretion/activation protein [Pseudomonas sp. C27(2019)]|uniref:ShlB/FhaC/HecB family hemolysin secretion/activation protein n=1 Tax=Pseudomonas sp. C27(2019) TaxID=2604941 RepID=UPI0012472FFF|nr:ShlB/FhaC/HecB family hemolysin secretion/activation protein [Pseudomonas sp. C27(2019)]QEY58324.1 ShlB/FhaC/HecB family hemolysin secretion/activation protein [Pseudomonas sp. C27(2019)]
MISKANGFATLIFLYLSSADAYAQLPIDIELSRERQERLLQEQQRRFDELQSLPSREVSVPSLPADDSSACLQVDSIELNGADVLSQRQRTRLLQPFVEQCLTANDLNRLLNDITNAYLKRGYVTTRAYLPPQDLQDGVLQIQVIEGRLESINGGDLSSALEISMSSPAKVGERLNLRELEQLIDQLSRLPSRQVSLELAPGDEVGGSNVVLQGQKLKPWRVALNRHNDGQRSTGEQQWGLSFVWDSPLGLADQLSVRGSGDTVSDKYKHSATHGLSYSLPYGWWTFNYVYNHSYYRTKTHAQGFSFVLDGVSTTHALSAERVVHRDALSKTAFSVGLNHLRSRNYLDNQRLDVSSQRLTEQQISFSHGRRIGSAFINVDLGYQRGIGALDAQRAGRPQGWEPVARYNKYTLTASYLHPFQLFGERFSFDSVFSAQRSEDVLFSPQRFSLGGLYSIRGFKEQTVTGDSGFYLRNQLRWTRPVTLEWLRPVVQEYSLTAAYDMGAIRGDTYNDEQSGRLASHAFELSARGQHLAASITAAQTLSRPNAIKRKERPIYFRVEVFF